MQKKNQNNSQNSNSTKNFVRENSKAEVDYVNNTIQEGFGHNNSKPFWRYVKVKLQDNVGVASLKAK